MISALRQLARISRLSWALYLADIQIWILFLVQFPRGLAQALFFFYLANAAGGYDQARFALIGNAIHISALYAMLYMSGIIENDKWNGTLIFKVAAPGNWLVSMLGLSAAQYTTVFSISMVIFVVFIPTSVPDISWLNFLRAIPLIFMTIVSVGTFGWLIGSAAFTTRWVEMLDNVVAYTLMIVCGINFPISALPDIIRVISQFVPLTNGLLAVRAVIDGASYASILHLIGSEIVIAFIYGAAAWITFHYRLTSLRRSGNFELM